MIARTCHAVAFASLLAIASVCSQDASELDAQVARLEKGPESPARDKALAIALAERAMLRHDAGEPEPAFEDLDRAMRMGLVDAGTFTMRGRILDALGDAPAAAQAFNLALERDPDYHPALEARALFAMQHGQYGIAIQDASRLIAAGRHYYFTRASAFMEIGDFATALADLSMDIQVTDEASGIAMSHERRARALKELGAPELALAELDKAEAAFRRSGDAGAPPVLHRTRGNALLALERYEAGIAEFTKALQAADENRAAIVLERAQAHAANRDWDASAADLATAGKLAAGDPLLLDYVRRGKRGLAAARAGTEPAGEPAELPEEKVAELRGSIEAAIGAGDLQSAARGIDKLAEAGHPDVPRMRGKLYALAGRHGDALGFLSRALREGDGKDAHLIAARASTLVRLNVYDLALPEFERAYMLGLDLPGSRMQYGIALSHFERHREAIAAFDFEIDKGDQQPQTWINRGYEYEKLGQLDKALADYRIARAKSVEDSEGWKLATHLAEQVEKRLGAE